MNTVLTKEEINAMAVACTAFSDVADHFVLDQESFARAIVAAVLAKFGEPVAWGVTYNNRTPALLFYSSEGATEEAKFTGGTASVMPLYAIKKEGS